MNGAAVAVIPSVGCRSLLPGHDFVDAYQVRADIAGLDARQAADAIIKNPPRWIKQLMATRNRLVRLFQLKTVEMGVDDPLASQRTVGGFPVVAHSAQEVVLGFDDKHLDFRISVTVAPGKGSGTQVTVATVVKTNNLLGRVYLAAVMPFHRAIVRHLLENASFGPAV
ncbi:Protein of unknown function [Collimonas sp. OK242]|jgi:hypothetical protein|uniref:DUF2867 domain-containing protein n=1 Tax=Collimonas sp. OK242 TaxID=1798195 RepID=UPI0008950CF5|nr:DUF2867 domain-containing protein [Collimonas sp. OK242]SDY11420.1 Protein of unknown function [Collimonas sp. OK242]